MFVCNQKMTINFVIITYLLAGSMIITANNCQINIICLKLKETVKDPEVGTPLFDPTQKNVDDACDS